MERILFSRVHEEGRGVWSYVPPRSATSTPVYPGARKA